MQAVEANARVQYSTQPLAPCADGAKRRRLCYARADRDAEPDCHALAAPLQGKKLTPIHDSAICTFASWESSARQAERFHHAEGVMQRMRMIVSQGQQVNNSKAPTHRQIVLENRSKRVHFVTAMPRCQRLVQERRSSRPGMKCLVNSLENTVSTRVQEKRRGRPGTKCPINLFKSTTTSLCVQETRKSRLGTRCPINLFKSSATSPCLQEKRPGCQGTGCPIDLLKSNAASPCIQEKRLSRPGTRCPINLFESTTPSSSWQPQPSFRRKKTYPSDMFNENPFFLSPANLASLSSSEGSKWEFRLALCGLGPLGRKLRPSQQTFEACGTLAPDSKLSADLENTVNAVPRMACS